jgi:hypothetical protein
VSRRALANGYPQRGIRNLDVPSSLILIDPLPVRLPINAASKGGERVPAHEESPKKYRDRPANEGKHGDAAEEPNSGPPDLPQDSPGRPKPGSSRQQKSQNQATQTGSAELDSRSAAGSQRPQR